MPDLSAEGSAATTPPERIARKRAAQNATLFCLVKCIFSYLFVSFFADVFHHGVVEKPAAFHQSVGIARKPDTFWQLAFDQHPSLVWTTAYFPCLP